jgi:hypothetical protein
VAILSPKYVGIELPEHDLGKAWDICNIFRSNINRFWDFLF